MAMDAFRLILEDMRKVRVQVASAHLASGLEGMGLFPYATIQELQVLDKSKGACLRTII